MGLLYGASFVQQSAAAAKPHFFGFATPRTVATDTLFEVANAATSAAGLKFGVDLNGRVISAAFAVGDVPYFETGVIAGVRRMASLAIGTANQVLRVNAGATAPEWFTLTAAAVAAGTFPSGAFVFPTSVDVSANGAFKYDGVNIIRASTAGRSQFYGGSGNLSATGTYNIGSGYNAILAVTSGCYNVALGGLALTALTTGNRDLAIGLQALLSLTTGSDNIAIGDTALAYVTTVNGNIGIGTSAGQEVTTGAYNTLVGYQTGRGITTGSYNTIIGAQVSGLAATLANNVIIADGQGNKRIQVDSAGVVTLNAGAITYGANDSGGTGYRLMRVPNA